MSKTLKIDQIKNELVRYVSGNKRALQQAILSPEIVLNKHAKIATKVKGHYHAVTAAMNHVVQIFDSKKFTPYGGIEFLRKELKNYHQKVDFLLDPADILGSMFEEMYDESKKLEQKSISKLAIQMLQDKVIDDVNYLSISGKYDPLQAGSQTPVFGTSMNGLNEIHKIIAADVNNPVYSIPGDAITETNIIDVVTEFEKQLPTLMKPRIKKIFMSLNDLETYQIAYEDKFGQNKF